MSGKVWKNGFWCLWVCVSVCFLSIVVALLPALAIQQVPLNQYGIRSSNPYVVSRFLEKGKSIDRVIVPSRPPGVFRAEVAVVPQSDIAAGINVLSDVPALYWSFGCSATSAAMMFGYYDNTGYPNMYNGPTNGGVFPMTNAVWGTATINGDTIGLCPLSATRLGLDGRTIRGHVDDYWVSYGSTAPDPFIGHWQEHTQGDCTGDYMGTNQSSFGNTDGSTTFYYYTDGSPLVDYTGSEPSSRDGCHGLRLFAESRGYTVVTNFSQYIYGYDGNTKGFTFNDFKNEIDAGRPVLIQLEGHTMLGYGYNETGQTIYVHDTWDYNDHSMTWGGSYDNMAQVGVTVLRLAPLSATLPTVTTTAVSAITASSASGGGNVSSNGGSPITARGVCWSTSSNPTTNDNFTEDGTGLGSFTSTLSGFQAGTTYHVRAYATNSTGTAYGNAVQFVARTGMAMPWLDLLLGN